MFYLLTKIFHILLQTSVTPKLTNAKYSQL